MEPHQPGWGPDRRPAAIAVGFDGLDELASLLDGQTGGGSVSPALRTIIDVLGDRELRATFFLDAAVAEAEPLALTLLANAGHELAALVDQRARADAVRLAVEALRRRGHPPAGVRLAADLPVAEHHDLAAAGVRYLAVTDGESPVAAGIVTIPVSLVDASLVAADPLARPDAPTDPPGFHRAVQVAVGTSLERGELLTVALHLGLLERRDVLDVVVESLDLVAGLARAGRVWTPTFDQLASWLLGEG